MVCDRHNNLNTAADAVLRPCTPCELVLSASSRSYGNMALFNNKLLLYTSTCDSSKRTQFLLVCMQAKFESPHFYNKAKKWSTSSWIELIQKWLLTVLKRIMMVKGTNPSWCVMHECGLEPLQFNWFPAAARLYNALTQINSSTARKILQADIKLSSRCDDCWPSHTLSAMTGLTQSYTLKERLLECEPIDLCRFVVDLRERPLDYWTPYSNNRNTELLF